MHHLPRHMSTRLLAALTAACIAVLLALPQPSYADVRKTDIVHGATVESIGYSTALCPDIRAERAIVLGADGVVYYERNADEQCHIASITKVMTAITALKNSSPNDVITVSQRAATVGESTAALKAGDSLTRDEALKALLWPSGNDAAIALAECVGASILQAQGKDASNASACEAAFVEQMNRDAAAIGLKDSLFSNPHGLDVGAYANETMYSTARDVAKLCAYAMSLDEIKSITSIDGGSITVSREGVLWTIPVESTDELLGQYEGVEGVKTGFTNSAGNCFAGAVNANGLELYSAVLGSTSETQRFTDTTTLWNWTYKHRITYPLAHAASYVDGKPVVALVSCTAWPDTTVKATLDNPDASVSVFDLDGNISQEATFREPGGSVRKGDTLGTITFYQHNNVVATAKLVAAEDVAGPNPFEGFGIWWQRLIGGGAAAESYLVNDTPLVLDKSAPIAP